MRIKNVIIVMVLSTVCGLLSATLTLFLNFDAFLMYFTGLFVCLTVLNILWLEYSLGELTGRIK
jgi:uncharacterized membrane protein